MLRILKLTWEKVLQTTLNHRSDLLHLLCHGLEGTLRSPHHCLKRVGDSPGDCGLACLPPFCTFHVQGFEVGSEMD